jgi:predicted nucleic acid-binding protein
VVRSLRILADAKQCGLIAAVRPLVENLLTNRYWIEEDVINSFLEEMGEV